MKPTELEKIKEELKENSEFLKKTYHVKKMGIFGSFARGDQTKKSDVDILIELSEPIGLFALVELEFFLSEKLHRKVDVVMKTGLKRAIKKQVLEQTIYV